MKNKKTIFLFDLNSFFALAEKARRPELKNAEIAIGKNNSHAIAVALTPGIKQKGGYVGMPIYKLKKIDPNIVFIDPDHSYYVNLSNSIFNFLKDKYTSKIQVSSIDEAYLDVTDILFEQRIKYKELAESIINDVQKYFNVTTSIGISSNMFLAKMASEFNKVNGYSTCFENEIETKLWTLDISKMYGVGHALKKYFNDININTIGDLANIQKNPKLTNKVSRDLGIRFNELLANANGYGKNNLDFDYGQAKSISKQITLMYKISDFQQASKLIKTISENVSKNLSKSKLEGNRINLLMRTNKFDQKDISQTLSNYIFEAKDIYFHALNLFEKIWKNEELFKGIRITISNLRSVNSRAKQLKFFDDKEKISEEFYLKKINNKIGFEALITGENFENNPKFDSGDVFKSSKVKFKSWK